MPNLLGVTSRLHYNIETLTTRLSANCGLRQFSMDKKGAKNILSRKTNIDQHTSLAIKATGNFRTMYSFPSGKYLRLLDKVVAKQFANLIMSKPAINPSCVVEMNPGLGLLTRQLLAAGVSKIHLLENLEHFHSNLNSIAMEYPGRVDLKHAPFEYLCHMERRNQTNKLHVFLEGLENRNWEADPTFHIIGAIPDCLFISRLINMVINHNSLVKYGRMIVHVAMPPSTWSALTAGNDNYRYYIPRNILFQILFRYHLLGTLPRKAFHPRYGKRHKRDIRYDKAQKSDRNFMCVVRIEARDDLYKDKLTEHDIVPFSSFVKHHYKRRKSRVIPEMEKWVPGCGRELIAARFDICTEFGELLPEEIIKLFLLFKSWPGYKTSNFLSMLDTFGRTPVEVDQQVFSSTIDNVDKMFKLSKDSTNAQVDMYESQCPHKFADEPK